MKKRNVRRTGTIFIFSDKDAVVFAELIRLRRTILEAGVQVEEIIKRCLCAENITMNGIFPENEPSAKNGDLN